MLGSLTLNRLVAQKSRTAEHTPSPVLKPCLLFRVTFGDLIGPKTNFILRRTLTKEPEVAKLEDRLVASPIVPFGAQKVLLGCNGLID